MNDAQSCSHTSASRRKVEERLQSAAVTEVGVVCPAVMSIQALNADGLIAPVAAAAVIVADLTMAVNAVAARPGHAASEIAAAWQPSRCTAAWAIIVDDECRGQHLGGDGRSNRLKSAVGRSTRSAVLRLLTRRVCTANRPCT